MNFYQNISQIRKVILLPHVALRIPQHLYFISFMGSDPKNFLESSIFLQ